MLANLYGMQSGFQCPNCGDNEKNKNKLSYTPSSIHEHQNNQCKAQLAAAEALIGV